MAVEIWIIIIIKTGFLVIIFVINEIGLNFL
jgi:hypothetical protein